MQTFVLSHLLQGLASPLSLLRGGVLPPLFKMAEALAAGLGCSCLLLQAAPQMELFF